MSTGMGVREWVSLLLLGVAIAVAAPFVRADAGGPDDEPREISLGTPVDEAESATPTSTATPERSQALPQPSPAWLVRYYTTGNDRVEAEAYFDEVDFAFEHAPFGDLHDDGWEMVVRGELQVVPGQYHFTVVHDGAVRVTVDGSEVASQGDGEGPQELEVAFQHAAGASTVTIEARDTGGPFLLQVR